jgi:hypothetical protein
MNEIHIGLDIHGVIDKYPFLFKKLSEKWASEGHNIHIITGQEWSKAWRAVKKAGVTYHEYFSIIDHHRENGTEMWQDEKGTWWMDEGTWVGTKGLYAREHGIKLHFDDSPEYVPYFPNDCIFIRVPKYNFDKTLNLFLTIDV